MAEYDLVVKNGTVATAADTFHADIAIRDGRIVALLDDVPAGAAREVLDATGKLVLPGGIEGHCHIGEPPFGGAELADDFESASIAAACGCRRRSSPSPASRKARPCARRSTGATSGRAASRCWTTAST